MCCSSNVKKIDARFSCFHSRKGYFCFKGIVNEIVVNLEVNSLKQFHISISLVKIMLNS